MASQRHVQHVASLLVVSVACWWKSSAMCSASCKNNLDSDRYFVEWTPTTFSDLLEDDLAGWNWKGKSWCIVELSLQPTLIMHISWHTNLLLMSVRSATRSSKPRTSCGDIHSSTVETNPSGVLCATTTVTSKAIYANTAWTVTKWFIHPRDREKWLICPGLESGYLQWQMAWRGCRSLLTLQ